MIGEDPEPRAEREVVELAGGILREREDAVLLVRAGENDAAAIKRCPERIADESVAEVALLARSAAVARHGEEAGIEDQLILLRLSADDGGENRTRDIF